MWERVWLQAPENLIITTKEKIEKQVLPYNKKLRCHLVWVLIVELSLPLSFPLLSAFIYLGNAFTYPSIVNKNSFEIKYCWILIIFDGKATMFCNIWFQPNIVANCSCFSAKLKFSYAAFYGL